MIGTCGDGSAAVRLIGGDKIADVDFRFAGELEAQVYPVLQLLHVAGLHHRHQQVLGDEARIGGNLGRFAPRIVSQHNEGPSFGMGSHQIAQGQRVRRHMDADAFLDADGSERGHLAAVDHGRGQGFVVGHGCADAPALEQLAQGVRSVKKT